MTQDSGRSWLEERRAQRRARQRRDRWEKLQGSGTQPDPRQRPLGAGSGPGPSHSPGAVQGTQYAGSTVHGVATEGAGAAPATTRRSPAGPLDRFLVLLYGAAGLVAAASVTGGTPLASDRWNLPVLIAGVVLALGFAWIARQAWPTAGAVLRVTAAAIGVIALLAGGIGAVSQNSVNGRVQLRGSAIDRALEMRAGMEDAAAILSDNQRLFTLTDEQALGLGDTFQAAFEQAVRIGERWNPATLTDPPLPEIVTAADTLNRAAARQAAAFDRRLADLTAPAESVRAQALELAGQVEALLGVDLPTAFADADAAIADAAGDTAKEAP